MKTLVAGWFSFENSTVTAGDVMAGNVVCDWLKSIGRDYDISFAPPFSGGVDWRLVDPTNYSHVVFVCGPFLHYPESDEFLKRFNDCRLIGIDLSMIEPLNIWNPFDVLIERDSINHSRPDLAFLAQSKKIPVVGIILVHPQSEYGDRGRHEMVDAAINRLIASQEMVAVTIDTCLDPNTTNLRNPLEVEILISRMDIVVTTRLHGTVLALKHGVPVLAIDAISGGAKVLRQAKTIGWSTVLVVDTLSDAALQEAFEYCKTDAAKAEASQCKERAIHILATVRDEFIAAMAELSPTNSRVKLPYETQNQLSWEANGQPLIYRVFRKGKRVIKHVYHLKRLILS